MFPTASLTTLLLLALSVAANPIVIRDSFIKVPFAKKLNVTGSFDLIQKDQARARALKAHGAAKASGLAAAATSIGVTNVAQVYVASVGVGSPATDYSLLIDTGSSNTWVGAGKKYVKTSTSKQTSNRVSVTYGSGSFSGTEFTDTVSLGNGLTVTGQSIGVASTSEGFDGFDGILGIGPDALTVGTLSPSTQSTIPTVTDNLASQGVIPSDLVAVSFEPTTSESDANGELTFGGTDSSKFTGSISFTSITGTSPANEFWGINESIKYGSTTILSTTAGIVDTGTTLILIATNAFKKYESATGATLDNETGLLKISTANFNKLSNLVFTVGSNSFTLTPNAQIWPRSLNTAIGGNANSIYLVVNDIGSNSGEGLDFINGFTFLERFYSVFDTTNNRVGFATTPFTTATTN
ncbi:family A1 protease [Artomyces pyxidatus]|uniref:Family A1 protease n=1 Tax=Artomyces pyxidatus TaxID=48021 RepID=A0ACB8STD7_9AGAM|nr:family A1 protease [Artomyces pyxidatus]